MPSGGKTIRSRQSASIVALERLIHSREERARSGVFYIEGMRFVAAAADAGAQIETLLVAPDLLTHPFGLRLVRRLSDRGISCQRISAGLYRDLSRVEEPQGIAAVVRQAWQPIESASASAGICWIALDTIRSTGNLGSILRTAEAVGAAGVIFVGNDIDPYDPAVVRATMGSPLFRLRLVRTTLAGLIAWKRGAGLRLIGSSPHSAHDYLTVDYAASPVALWLGGERQGLSGGIQSLCDSVVRIPMVGRSDSLNVSVAAGVLLYEVSRQRRGR
jgi:TrmH family RNA methyltransferase